ncbi:MULTISPECIES: hypothetical protein [unclassified Burkholderia]|uniref:hypothetical protein n=1 Tax=unclassified Burkholderia TaxID=2613784 RepID=UPI000F5AEB38|nr:MULTISPECIES: hypothetical protein [unclassified Burkholderia]RQS18246.1 hypothetical protein DIE05_36570 [Burkholderia sp. Bp8995]RQS38376.1 hypothetical protein DIE00_36315 [Burkholderia sp. Bp8989]
MNDDTPRDAIEPDDAADSQFGHDQNEGASSISADRGMPELGQYRGARPRAWWLTPVGIVLVVGVGAVWTVHGFLARHDAEAKARRDAMAGTSSQGRLFKELPASSAGGPASAPVPASPIAVLPASTAGALAPARTVRAAVPRSYYDAPLAVLTAAMLEQGFSQRSVARVHKRAERMLVAFQREGIPVPMPKVFDPNAPSDRNRRKHQTSERTPTPEIERTPGEPSPPSPSR